MTTSNPAQPRSNVIQFRPRTAVHPRKSKTLTDQERQLIALGLEYLEIRKIQDKLERIPQQALWILKLNGTIKHRPSEADYPCMSKAPTQRDQKLIALVLEYRDILKMPDKDCRVPRMISWDQAIGRLSAR